MPSDEEVAEVKGGEVESCYTTYYIITKRRVEFLCRKYSVPDLFDFHLPSLDELSTTYREGHFYLYELALEFGFYLLVPPFVANVLGFYNLALTQLVSNVYFFVVSFLIICLRLGVCPSVTAFYYFF